jgi:two-component system, chemotaxis family, response regulator Rcp1
MVYLVDDDDEDLELVQEALVLNSYKGPVKTASDGIKLMSLLQDVDGRQPDVIVLDLNMPRKDGFSALKEIKDHPIYKKIPVIILTASSAKTDRLKCFELGCSSFFTKPTKMDEYIPVVSAIKKTMEN